MSDYPYPKLMKGLDDYPASSIDCEISEPRDAGGHFIFDVSFTLDDAGINSLIERGDAGFALCIECVPTNTREFNFVERNCLYRLTKSGYSGQVEITPCVVMRRRVAGYTSSSLNQDYDGFSIELPKGAMIAQCEQYTMRLFRGSKQSTESICDFVASDDGRLFYTDSGDKIEIHIPERAFDSLKALRKVECSKVFTSMFVVPVIQSVIQTYWKDSSESVDSRWYISLKDVIDEHFPAGIEDMTSFQVAVGLLDSMLVDSATYLAKHYGDSDVC